jgi:N-alpha-acetyltransferase 30
MIMASSTDEDIAGIRFVDYVDESQLEHVMSLVGRDLSEPYSSTFAKPCDPWLLSTPSLKTWCCLIPLFPAVFTYRYFLYRYPNLCILAVNEANDPIGCVVGKIDEEEIRQPDEVSERQIMDQENDAVVHEPVRTTLVGYIGMLAVSSDYRRRGIGKALVQRILRRMQTSGCTSATLETEVTNVTAMRLYQDIFGFIREELLVRYYLNWNDAYRLRLWFL